MEEVSKKNAKRTISFTLREADVKVLEHYQAHLLQEFGIADMSLNNVARALMTKAVQQYVQENKV